MFVELFELDDCFMVEITPAYKDEEELVRNAIIIHKNNLLVYWGDTLPLKGGLKISLKKEDVKVAQERPADEK